jgi:diguanylate cyclase (GGDEF)-like protein
MHAELEKPQPDVGRAARRLADENALLRAALAELRERLTEFEESADRDDLTPLHNRRHFAAELGRVASQAERHGTPAAMLHIGVDGLAELAAAHGQLARDAALIHLARLLKNLIRTTDVAARIDEDGFGLILDHLDHNSAIETAERIARRISSSPLDAGGSQIPLRVTIGTAAILPGDEAEDVLERARSNLERMRDF